MLTMDHKILNILHFETLNMCILQTCKPSIFLYLCILRSSNACSHPLCPLFFHFYFVVCYRTVCRKGLKSLSQGFETGVTGASPPTVTSMGGSFYLGGLVQGRCPYVIWVSEGLKV